jgi:hypothetical protein
MALSITQVATSTTAGTILAAQASSGSITDPRIVTVKNVDAAVVIYIGVLGGPTVTAANGYPLRAGDSLTIAYANAIEGLTAIAASLTPSVAVIVQS